MSTPFLKECADGIRISIKLQPRASRQEIGDLHGAELRVSVTAPPVDAAANRALIEYLAEILDTARSRLALVRGQKSRHKTVLVTGMSAAAVAEKLQRAAK